MYIQRIVTYKKNCCAPKMDTSKGGQEFSEQMMENCFNSTIILIKKKHQSRREREEHEESKLET